MKTKISEFDGVEIRMQKGDIISSKKGFLSKSPISKEWFIYTRARYEGNGCFVILSEKEAVNVKTYQRKVE